MYFPRYPPRSAPTAARHAFFMQVRDQLAGLTDSLGQLLTNVEKNRSIMALLNNMQEMPVPIAPARKVRARARKHALCSNGHSQPALPGDNGTAGGRERSA